MTRTDFSFEISIDGMPDGNPISTMTMEDCRMVRRGQVEEIEIHMKPGAKAESLLPVPFDTRGSIAGEGIRQNIRVRSVQRLPDGGVRAIFDPTGFPFRTAT